MKTKASVQFLSFLFIFSLSCAIALFGQQKPFKVVLDAGHGGHDTGASYYGINEKEIVLNVTLRVGEILEKNKNIAVIYTRNKDVFLGLRERADIANKENADLFISIHCNGAKSAAAYGAETFVLGLHKSEDNFEIAKKENQVIYLEDNYEETYGGFDPNSPESLIGLTLLQEEYLDQSIALAATIQTNFAKKLNRKDRSVKQAGFWVLHNTYMPSVLIETGFISNKSEGTYLNSKKGQEDMAMAIAQAILDYYKGVEVSYNAPTNNIPTTTTSPTSSQRDEVIYEDVVFKVQIAASSKKLDTKPYNFKGLKNISRDKQKGLYKYYFGNTPSYNEVKNLQKEAKAKGYTTAYIVAFKKGEKVKLSEIIK